MRAAIYARVSTADGRQDVDNQLAELRGFAETQDWEIERSTSTMKAAAKRIESSSVGCFPTHRDAASTWSSSWALDRLTREGVAETFEYIKRLTSYGVQFVSFKEEHFRTTGPAGEPMIAVAAWIAKQERVRISDRVRAGMRRARVLGTRSGRAIGRPRAVFHHDEARELRRQGWSWREIARKFGVGAATIRRVCPKEPSDGRGPESGPEGGSEESRKGGAGPEDQGQP